MESFIICKAKPIYHNESHTLQYSKLKLFLPTTFARFHGIDAHEKIVLMDRNGVKRLVRLIQDGPREGIRGLGHGWKLFCEANDVLKPDVSFVLEFLWEDSVHVLKFATRSSQSVSEED